MQKREARRSSHDFPFRLCLALVAIFLGASACSTRPQLASTAYGPPANPVLRSALENSEELLEQTRISTFQVDAPAPEAWRQLQGTLRDTGKLPEMIGFVHHKSEEDLDNIRVTFSVRNVSARELLDHFSRQSPYDWELVAFNSDDTPGFIAVNPKGTEAEAFRRRFFRIDRG